MGISEEDYQKAVAVVMDCSSGSVSNLQRKLYWGYGRAAAAIDRMQDEFIVSSMSASGRRDVYPEEIHQLWKELQVAKAQVPESNALLSAAMDAVQKLGSGDFVLVPKKPDVDKAWNIALKRIVPPPKINDVVQKELMCKKYVDDLCFEQDRILLNYEEMIEAQEQKG